MRTVDSAIRCPICGHRSKPKVEAFDHERPHLERVSALIVDCRDWLDLLSVSHDGINEALRRLSHEAPPA